MKVVKQVQCPECKTWAKIEYEQTIVYTRKNYVTLRVRLFDSLGYETQNLDLDLDVNPDIPFEQVKKRKKLLNRIALDYARLKGYKASYAEVSEIEENDQCL